MPFPTLGYIAREEEFAIRLPNTDEADAMAMARRFQSALQAVTWMGGSNVPS
jgi:GGDEF domain-containing protein